MVNIDVCCTISPFKPIFTTQSVPFETTPETKVDWKSLKGQIFSGPKKCQVMRDLLYQEKTSTRLRRPLCGRGQPHRMKVPMFLDKASAILQQLLPRLLPLGSPIQNVAKFCEDKVGELVLVPAERVNTRVDFFDFLLNVLGYCW